MNIKRSMSHLRRYYSNRYYVDSVKFPVDSINDPERMIITREISKEEYDLRAYNKLMKMKGLPNRYTPLVYSSLKKETVFGRFMENEKVLGIILYLGLFFNIGIILLNVFTMNYYDYASYVVIFFHGLLACYFLWQIHKRKKELLAKIADKI